MHPVLDLLFPALVFFTLTGSAPDTVYCIGGDMALPSSWRIKSLLDSASDDTKVGRQGSECDPRFIWARQSLTHHFLTRIKAVRAYSISSRSGGGCKLSGVQQI